MSATSGTPSFTLPTALWSRIYIRHWKRYEGVYDYRRCCSLENISDRYSSNFNHYRYQYTGTAVVGDSLRLSADGTNWWMTSQTWYLRSVLIVKYFYQEAVFDRNH